MSVDSGNEDSGILPLHVVESLLQRATDICGGARIVDIHVHATEVIRGSLSYADASAGIFSAVDSKPYSVPVLTAVRTASASAKMAGAFKNRLSELAFTRAYHHTGPRVLADHLDLAGVGRAVLLPVDNAGQSVAEQMVIVDNCCHSDSRFLAGYCLPNDVPTERIEDDLRNAKAAHGIRILKVHPNLTGLDLGSDEGIDRMHSILRAADAVGLPVLLHGGYSPILGDSPASAYSTISNLSRVDWSLASTPVVIAHFGVYGCAACGESGHEPPIEWIQELLQTHENVYTDTSGVSYEVIEKMLGVLDPAKVVFGSDALYVPVFRQLAYVLHALERHGYDDAVVRQILCENAAHILGDT